jgi:hypothetical protein
MTITTDNQTFKPAGPTTEATKFYVIAKPEPTDAWGIAATSKTFGNAAKRASELQAKRYNWHTARVMVEA